jgi:hypothetical protein
MSFWIALEEMNCYEMSEMRIVLRHSLRIAATFLLVYATLAVSPSTARAVGSVSWDSTGTQGRYVRLLASTQEGAYKWCLAVDENPVNGNVAVTRYQEGQILGTPFNASTGCWSTGGALRYFAAFEIPMWTLAAGSRTFSLTLTFADSSVSTITTSVTVVKQPPRAHWDWLGNNRGQPLTEATGAVSFGFSTTDPVTKWCLVFDDVSLPYDLSQTRHNDYELSDANYDISTGCWATDNGASIFTGALVIPTYLFKNGPHTLRLRAIDRYGESSVLETSFTSKNRTAVRDISISSNSRRYPSQKAQVFVSAVAGAGSTKYSIYVGSKKVKSGKVGEYGLIRTTIGNFKTSTTIKIKIKVVGINGTATSKTRTVNLPAALANPVPPALPERNSSTLRIRPLLPNFAASGIGRAIVAQDCVMKVSPMSSSWHGQGYDWKWFYIYSDGTRSVGRMGFGYIGGTQGFAIPPACHL